MLARRPPRLLVLCTMELSPYSSPLCRKSVCDSEAMRIRLALILIALGIVVAAVLEGGNAGARFGVSRAASWGGLQVLVPASQYAFDPQLAVAEDGQTL